MRIVVALGGNALLRRGERAEAETQRAHVLEAASALAALAAEDELVITHGNGPQVGLLALEADAYEAVAPYPLDVLGAESQGMIGYFLVQALRNELPGRDVVAVLTQVLVAADDAAFTHPTKPIGPVYTEEEARLLAAERGWTIAPDGTVLSSRRPFTRAPDDCRAASDRPSGRRRRRRRCAGGGGVPVVADGRRVRGVEAVIDKDLTAALLAEAVGAEKLIMLTDVPYVERGWGTPEAAPIKETTPAELRRLSFAAGSMAPKVEAACRFVEHTGGQAVIGSLAELLEIAGNRAGTRVAVAHTAEKPHPRCETAPMARAAGTAILTR